MHIKSYRGSEYLARVLGVCRTIREKMRRNRNAEEKALKGEKRKVFRYQNTRGQLTHSLIQQISQVLFLLRDPASAHFSTTLRKPLVQDTIVLVQTTVTASSLFVLTLSTQQNIFPHTETYEKINNIRLSYSKLLRILSHLEKKNPNSFPWCKTIKNLGPVTPPISDLHLPCLVTLAHIPLVFTC